MWGTIRLRLELRYKLVLGFFGVAVMSVALPPQLEQLGISPWLALCVALLLAVGAGSVLSHRVTRNIRNLRACTDLISRGDLTAKVQVEVGRLAPDETVDLARSIDGMLQNLRELVEHIQNAADQVAHSSRDLSLSSHGVKTTNLEIASTMESVATGALKQEEDVRRTAARSHDVSDALSVNAAAAREAAALAVEADETSIAGVGASRLTIEKMQSLFQKVEEASSLVVEFEQKVQFVHRITEMITTVADKTHLLSLNASIEAARAGDAGRGFSAVADEIRKLAENAGTQAEQIEELIRELEEQSRGISGVMQGMGAEMKEGRVELDRVSNALEQIQARVSQVNARSETIARTAEEQAVAAGQIVEDINGVSSVASQNAAASDEMRGALEIQTGGMEQMVSHAAALSEMSAQLGEVARRFRTR